MKKMISLILLLALISMVGCGQSASEPESAPVDMQALYDSMLENMPEMILLDDTMMLNYCGIAKEDCTQAFVAVCDDGLKTDEIWLIEAANEDALEKLQGLAELRLKAKAEESISYSPEQYAVVEKAECICEGLYMALIVSPEVDTLAEIYNAAVS